MQRSATRPERSGLCCALWFLLGLALCREAVAPRGLRALEIAPGGRSNNWRKLGRTINQRRIITMPRGHCAGAGRTALQNPVCWQTRPERDPARFGDLNATAY